MEAYWDGRKLCAGHKSLYATRLAEGIIHTGKLSDEAVNRSIGALREIIRRSNGTTLYAYATSAVRDAVNGKDFVKLVRKSLGLVVDVLSGEREGWYAYMGAAGEGALIDIGGGSTQLVDGGLRLSWPLGCVRAKDYAQTAGGGPLAVWREPLREVMLSIIQPLELGGRRLTGVGGTITTLAALALELNQFSALNVHGYRLDLESIRELIRRLDNLGASGRRGHPLLGTRHDVILPGAVILEYLMERLGANDIHVSESDGMEGYFMHMVAAREGALRP